MDALITLPGDPRPAIDCLAGYLRGEVTDPLELAHAAYHMLGYGLGVFHNHPTFSAAPADCPDCPKEIVKQIVGLTTAKGVAADAAAIDWATVITLAFQLIQILLKKS